MRSFYTRLYYADVFFPGRISTSGYTVRMATDPLLNIRQAKLDLKRADIEWKHAQANKRAEAEEKMRNRALDFEYLKLTVVLVLVVIVIWFLTCRFGFGNGIGGPGSPNAKSAQPREGFSPYASILSPDTYRTDSSFDYANDMPYKDPDWSQRMNVDFNSNAQAITSEDKLFNQTHDLVL